MFESLCWLNRLSGVVVVLTAILAPRTLGATTWETIWALNGLGFLSGVLWIAERVIRSRFIAGGQPSAEYPGARWPMACVWGLVITLLSYVLCTALNPKASLRVAVGTEVSPGPRTDPSGQDYCTRLLS
jgi:hypothetical protein